MHHYSIHHFPLYDFATNLVHDAVAQLLFCFWVIYSLLRITYALSQLRRKQTTMSDDLDSKLAQLDTTVDQVIDILSTDKSDIAALQASVDALKAEQGDDSDEVAKAQTIIDKLTAAITPGQSAPVEVAPTTEKPTGDAGTTAEEQAS